MEEVYFILPEDVENPLEMFTRGIFYGRFRINYLRHESTDQNKRLTDKPVFGRGLGGSLIWKSGFRKGFGTTIGYYISFPVGIKDNDVKYGKSGKDTFKRRRRDSNGDGQYDYYEAKPLMNLAQAYVEYRSSSSNLKIGRQIFESTLTASNDTKMVPNTFSGVGFYYHRTDDMVYKFGFFISQKLRNHNRFHDLLVRDGWRENDDSGNHLFSSENVLKGSSGSKLIVMEYTRKVLVEASMRINLTSVPGNFSTLCFDLYPGGVEIGELGIKSAFRYMQQINRGINSVIKANPEFDQQEADTDGRVSSLANCFLFAFRFDLSYLNWKMRLAWHRNSERGDFIAPWRGFPTGGFTRTMTEVNWTAGTEAYFCGISGKFGTKLSMDLALAFNDRPGSINDTLSQYCGLWYNVNPSLILRFRMMNHSGEGERDFIDSRFEINYLF